MCLAGLEVPSRSKQANRAGLALNGIGCSESGAKGAIDEAARAPQSLRGNRKRDRMPMKFRFRPHPESEAEKIVALFSTRMSFFS
jgi:hypothetical protein